MTSLFHLPDWISLVLIWSIWSIVPFSWSIVILRVFGILKTSNPSSSLNSNLFYILPLLEVVFSIYQFYSILIIQSKSNKNLIHHPIDFIRSTFEQALANHLPVQSSFFDSENPNQNAQGFQSFPFDHPIAIEFRSHQALWFKNCDWNDIKRDNMIEWLAWSLLDLKPNQIFAKHNQIDLQKSQSDLLFHALDLIEKRAGCKFKSGYNPKLSNQSIRLSIDPIQFQFRPFAFYLFSSLSTLWVKNNLIKTGFKYLQCTKRSNDGLKYLIRKPSNWNHLNIHQRPRPIIIFHGLAFGLLQYYVLMNYLAHSTWAKKRPIIIAIQPSISQEIFSSQHLKPLKKESLTADILQLIEGEGFDKTGIDLFGHSKGSIVVGWLVKALSEKKIIKRICLVDPVCFCLWEPHVCYNFLYSKPKNGIERLIRYFLSSELGIANDIQKNFDWITNVLWPSEIRNCFENEQDFQNNVKVILAEEDSILNANRVKDYLVENGMKLKLIKAKKGHYQDISDQENGGIVFLEGYRHGQSLIESASTVGFKQVKNWFEFDK
ncbi:hypothetical protein O181_015521 [Austropuccinia psidii MF-1]|uniref:AB hydrolase-1 domain-containing protein n=1 Tax=Austropuccinia psidii MF-1 TaxID=1389203 RepID=A0A9Q3C3X0_9BASI|nr:hypothetical protein [Austropuccinia psidii MF-1]